MSFADQVNLLALRASMSGHIRRMRSKIHAIKMTRDTERSFGDYISKGCGLVVSTHHIDFFKSITSSWTFLILFKNFEWLCQLYKSFSYEIMVTNLFEIFN